MNPDSPSRISICRLCCCKMYSGEAMSLSDTEKVKAWFRWYSAIELEFLPGFSNEFCHFCLFKLDLFLKMQWKNEKTFYSSAARTARRTSLDRGTYGWAFCRVCLGSVRNPESCLTIHTYGIQEINTLMELFGFKVTFLPDFPDYLCFLCVSSIHKFLNLFMNNKENFTPHLACLYRNYCRTPVPKLEHYTKQENMPDINNTCTSIVEILFSPISVDDLRQNIQLGAAAAMQKDQQQPASMTKSQHQPVQVIRPQPQHLHSQPNQVQPMHPFLMGQMQMNQYLNTARNLLTTLPAFGGPTNPMMSPLAVQMAMAQTGSNHMLLNPFTMAMNMAPPATQPQNPFYRQFTPLHHLNMPNTQNLFVKRMNTDVLPEEPPEKKRRRRGRKSQPMQLARSDIPEGPYSSPEPAGTGVLPSAVSPTVPTRLSPVQQFQSRSSPPAMPVAVSPPVPVKPTQTQQSVMYSGPSVIQTAPPAVQPTALPSFKNAFGPHKVPASSPSQPNNPPTTEYVPQQPSVPSSSPNLPHTVVERHSPVADSGPKLGSTSLTSTANLVHEMGVLLNQPDHPPATSPPRVPPIKIKISTGQIVSPTSTLRTGLPDIVQRRKSPGVQLEQARITLYKGELSPGADSVGRPNNFDDLSLKSLLENSPPAMGASEGF